MVMGDMPYNTKEINRERHFERLIAAINKLQPAFSIHIGDIKSGSTLCDDATFEKIKAYFMTFQQPLVYTPGDNEWTDCHRKSNGPFDPTRTLSQNPEHVFPQGSQLGTADVVGHTPERCERLYADGRECTLGDAEHPVCDGSCGWQ